MKKIMKYIPEALVVVGVLVILGLVVYLHTLAGLFSLGIIMIIAGLFAAKARG